MPAPAFIDADLTLHFWSAASRQAVIAGLSWARIAARLGLDEGLLCRMRSGKLHTPFDVAIHTAKILRCPALLDDALALVSESVPSPVADPMQAGRAVVDEACGLISEWTAAAPGGISKEEAQALLVRAERQAARLRELTEALVKVVDGLVTREAYRG